MEFPITKNQVSTRFSDEELEVLNEVIGKLFPDQDFTDPTLTMRTLLFKIVETADLKLHKVGQSRPEDLQRIKELEILLNSEKEVTIEERKRNEEYQSKIDELITDYSKLEARNTELETALSGISTEHTEVKEKARNLEKYAPVPNEMRIIIEPLTSKVLALYAEKIRIRNKSEATPGEILTSLFNRYITKRETELPGFPFLVSKQEIANLAKELDNE